MLGGDGALGGEFFRWEFATAVAGAVLGINPFDEPNVTESKDNTKRVLDQFRHDHKLPAEEPLSTEGRLTLSGDAPLRLSGADGGLAGELRRHLARASTNGYYALQAYIAPTDARDARAARDRDAAARQDRPCRDRRLRPALPALDRASCTRAARPSAASSSSPRTHPDDLEIPGWHETFGTLIDAQAAGDFISLEVARPARGADQPVGRPDAGLAELRAAFEQALSEPLRALDVTAEQPIRRTHLELAIVGLGPHGGQHGSPAAPGGSSGHRVQSVARQDARDHRRGPGGRLHASRTWSSMLSAPRIVWLMVPAGRRHRSRR